MDCHAERSEAGEAILGGKLRALGLPSLKHIVFHRNRVVLLTFSRGVLRLHEGYASAPDDVLRAIARFLSPSTRRRDRLAARRTFIGFPVEQHAPSHGPAEPPSRPLAALGASYAAEPPSLTVPGSSAFVPSMPGSTPSDLVVSWANSRSG